MEHHPSGTTYITARAIVVAFVIMTSVTLSCRASVAGSAMANNTRCSSARRASTTGSSRRVSLEIDRSLACDARTPLARPVARSSQFQARPSVKPRSDRWTKRTTIATEATSDDDDPPVVGKSKFDFDAEMMADMERLKADSPLAKEQAEEAAAGIVKTESQMKMEALKEGIDTFLLYDFFVILAILSWLIVGVLIRLSYKQGLAYDEPFLGLWLILWPFLFQPLLGVHMLATLVSPIIGKLKDRGLVSKDTWT